MGESAVTIGKRAMTEHSELQTNRQIIIGFFAGERQAEHALNVLVERDFPLDRVSILGKAGASGDDPLGVYYPTVGDRMKGWGRMGALWGGLFGLLGGAAGMFVLPGLGAVVAIGPIAEALVGAAAGAGLGGGVLAGGAALSELTHAIHRMGIPQDRLEEVQRHLEQGRYLLLLIVDQDATDDWLESLRRAGADPVWRFPYAGLTDAVAAQFSGEDTG
jgi:hypothetical protein